MAYLRSGLDVALLFVAGLALGIALQLAGILPGNALARLAAGWRTAPEPARVVVPMPQPQPEITPFADDPLVRLVPRFPPSAPPLVGDADPTRNGLRRAVIAGARRAVAEPCSLERRVAFQSALRDYARAWANSPRTVRERSDFRTPLDAEAVRSIGLAHRSGLIDPELIARWRGLERVGLDELLARENGTLGDPTPEPCPSARQADAGVPATAL
jgi:hypothetical protein